MPTDRPQTSLSPLLIMGSPRSGTTFLAHMVNRFFDIRLSRDNGTLVRYYELLSHYEPLSDDANPLLSLQAPFQLGNPGLKLATGFGHHGPLTDPDRDSSTAADGLIPADARLQLDLTALRPARLTGGGG